MRTRLVRIGNSRGLKLTKSLLEQCGFGDEVDLVIRNGRLEVSSVVSPRAGWEAVYARMAQTAEDRPLEAETATLWDRTEWEW